MGKMIFKITPSSQGHNSWLWSCVFAILTSCQSGVPGSGAVDTALESDIVSGLRNLPARVFPNEYDRVAYVDRDFRVSNAQASEVGEFAVLKTYFATNRGYNEEELPYRMFNEASIKGITFGKNYVIVPREPELQPNEPDTLFTLDISGAKYEPSLSQNNILSPDDFSESINSDIQNSNEASALIYVHGFNESYERSVIRASQISYDLAFPGSTFIFSWPARHSVATYLGDLQRARDSERYFELFMSQILSTTSTNRIYIIAHHMGGRLVSAALKHMFSIQPSYKDRIREIILVAPDIEASQFTEQFTTFIGTENAPITLYTSANDPSLAVSKQFSTNRLAGDAVGQLVISANVETINAGTTDLSLNGHSNYTDTSSILGDIWDLVRNNLRANSRSKLTSRFSPEGPFWEYPR
tara:strand:+ start:6337 stop:7575 length:1239 start_codon:yes stop_codon:yes gene_type:complete